jgi:hypothetical protein
MRTHSIDDTTIEYPDEIAFCFNPVVINILGHAWASVAMIVTDTVTNDSHTEKRTMFDTSCFFDMSFYTQAAFDSIDFNKVDYTASGAQDSKLGRLFSVELDLYNDDGTLGNSFQFNTFVIWGAMKIGERYNGDRVLTWFKNYPFTVGMYTAAAGSVNVTADGVALDAIALPDRKVYNLMLNGIDAKDEVRFELPGSEGVASVFDNTFDFTFQALTNVAATVRLLVDSCTDGVYLRWINRHGFYCYWLFHNGDESRQVANDGEFIRNNMQDYNYVNGYHGGTGRKQRKTENNTIPICAPLVNSDTYDFLFQLALTPVVDMYAGKDVNGVDRWKAVNVSVETFVKARSVLQDFVATIILPETRVQSL